MRSVKHIVAGLHTDIGSLSHEVDWIGNFINARNPEDMLKHANQALAEAGLIQRTLLDLAVRLERQCERRALEQRKRDFRQVVEAAGKHRIAAARKVAA